MKKYMFDLCQLFLYSHALCIRCRTWGKLVSTLCIVIASVRTWRNGVTNVTLRKSSHSTWYWHTDWWGMLLRQPKIWTCMISVLDTQVHFHKQNYSELDDNRVNLSKSFNSKLATYSNLPFIFLTYILYQALCNSIAFSQSLTRQWFCLFSSFVCVPTRNYVIITQTRWIS